MKQKPLILVSNRLFTFPPEVLNVSNDCIPHQDFTEIAKRLDGEIIGYNLSEAEWYRWVRKIEMQLKFDAVEVLSAVKHLSKHNAVLSTSEKTALPLAMVMGLMPRKPPHLVIGHKLSSGWKKYLLQGLQVHRAFSHIICLCRTQADYALKQLKMVETAVDFVYDKVDHRFFRPLPEKEDGYILAVGQEQRDYDCLLRAINGTNLKLIVVASSPWSTTSLKSRRAGNTDQVTLLSHIPFKQLRMLYAQAKLVVIPLCNVDYAAGVNSVLEAMAMARPVIVSQTPGISDYIINNETGVFSPPGDPAALRDTILSLWEHPAELDRLGTNARQIVEEQMNLDIYADRIAEIVRRVAKQ